MGYIPKCFTNSSPGPYGQLVSETLCPAIMLLSPHKGLFPGPLGTALQAGHSLHTAPNGTILPGTNPQVVQVYIAPSLASSLAISNPTPNTR